MPISNINISVKVVLDSQGRRPTSGSYRTNDQIKNAVVQLNRALDRLNCSWRADLLEIRDVDGVSQWLNMQCSDKSNFEVAAEAQPNLYAWNPRAVNIYIVNDLTPCGGVCSFPAGDPSDEIILIQNNGGITNDGIGWLHEIGHYLGLQHTDDDDLACIPNGQCTDVCPDDRNIMSRKSGLNASNCVFSACQKSIMDAAVDPTSGPRRHVLGGSGAPTSGSMFFSERLNNSSEFFRFDFSTATKTRLPIQGTSTSGIEVVGPHIYWSHQDGAFPVLKRADLPGGLNALEVKRGAENTQITAFKVYGNTAYWAEVSTLSTANYRSELKSGTLQSTSSRSLFVRDVYGDNTGITSIALDPPRNMMYFAMASTVFLCFMSSGGATTLLSTPERIDRLAIDLDDRWMFWMSSNGRPFAELYRANLDSQINGFDLRRLVTTGDREKLHCGLAVNLGGRELYYADNRGAIRMADFYGRGIVTAIAGSPGNISTTRSVDNLAFLESA